MALSTDSSNGAGDNMSNLGVRFKKFAINPESSLEKKLANCDRFPHHDFEIKDNGKQGVVYLQTAMYEIFKVNWLDLLKSQTAVEKSSVIPGNDTNDNNIEIQVKANVEFNQDETIEISMFFFHTTCNILVQSCVPCAKFLRDGQSSVEVFMRDFLSPALCLLSSSVNIDECTNQIRSILVKSISRMAPSNSNIKKSKHPKKKTEQTTNANTLPCKLCHNVKPPRSNHSQNTAQCQIPTCKNHSLAGLSGYVRAALQPMKS